MKKVLVVLADGFEEVEALTPVDWLRRAKAEVVLAGLGRKEIQGSHGIKVLCDCELSETPVSGWAAVVLPGGMPGAVHLAESEEVRIRVTDTYKAGNFVCAICASPAVVLGPLGILEGKKAVCYPGMEEYAPEVDFTDAKCVTDGNCITARGAGCASEFGFAIVRALFGDECASDLARKVIA